MVEIFRRQALLTGIVMLCLLVGAGAQLLVPRLVYQVFEFLLKDIPWSTTLLLLVMVIVAKGLSLSFSSAYSARLEVEICYALRTYIQEYGRALPTGRKLTLIKEDAERVASAVIECLNLVASLLLSVAAAIYLLRENIYFAVPLGVVLLMVCIYLKVARPGVETRYKAELEKDEMYKHELGALIKRVEQNESLDDELLVPLGQHLGTSVTAGFIYERWRMFVAFLPEVALAGGTAAAFLSIAFWTPEMFDYKIIVYLGYLGIISMSSIHVVEIMLSLIGVRQSIHRIKDVECH